MTRMTTVCVTLAMASGCVIHESGGMDDGFGGGIGVDAPTGGDTPGGSFAYEAFTARTQSLGDGNYGYFLLSLTDTTGSIACSLSKDFRAGLGNAGHQILANLGYIAGYPCPTGTHSMHGASCPIDLDRQFSIGEGCAYYRRFDNTGRVVGTVAATAGAITVTGNEAACTFQVHLSFGGKGFSNIFTLTNGIVANPWCSQ